MKKIVVIIMVLAMLMCFTPMANAGGGHWGYFFGGLAMGVLLAPHHGPPYPYGYYVPAPLPAEQMVPGPYPGTFMRQPGYLAVNQWGQRVFVPVGPPLWP
jgi:hypothetical protein